MPFQQKVEQYDQGKIQKFLGRLAPLHSPILLFMDCFFHQAQYGKPHDHNNVF